MTLETHVETGHHILQLTLQTKNIHAHSLLSGMSESELEDIQNVLRTARNSLVDILRRNKRYARFD